MNGKKFAYHKIIHYLCGNKPLTSLMARKRNNSGALRNEQRDIHDRVISFYNTQPRGGNAAFNYKQVAAAIGCSSPRQRALVAEALELLAIDGFLAEVGIGRYRAAGHSTVAEGLFVRRSNGKNGVIIDGENDTEPIMVAERNSMHALNGDRVAVHISAARGDHEPEAQVIKIIKRKEQTFVGTIHLQRYFATLNTDSKFLATDIFIPLDKTLDAQNGQKVVARIVEWPEEANSPIGEVVDVLGEAGENDTEIHAILAEYGLPYKYPENIERAANRLQPGITPEEVARRRDMRDVTTFTIDPADAKDFDDALSLRRLPDGLLEVGVHIADVTHYVKPKSVINTEAYERGTSVYLVDRTVPMLPERLCNFICSLREGEDKLTHSVIFQMDAEANVIKYEICHTVINSDRRLSYEQAQEILDGKEDPLRDTLVTLNELALKMRAARFDNGAVLFERPEIKFDIDENGKPMGVIQHIATPANNLIEEFMLLANRTVAAHIGSARGGKTPKAMVYRIHDEPNEDKLANLADVAASLGYRMAAGGNRLKVNRSINEMLKRSEGKPEHELLSIMAMRAMAKAVYSPENIGHYGLGFEFYTHFTSPIRRYPDMMVHRLLDRYAAGGRSVAFDQLADECKHCSEREQLAANAERASIKYKEVEFMGDRLGQVFEGTISGVTEWGIYVEVNETHCEGMVGARDLDDDYYEFDEKAIALIGRRTHRKYQLGDPVTIQVARADLVKKQLDFVLVDKRHPAGSHRIDREPITYRSRRERLETPVDAPSRGKHRRGGSRRKASAKKGPAKPGDNTSRKSRKSRKH